LGQVACGGDKEEGGSSGDGGTSEVSFVVANSMLNFAKEMGEGFKVGVSRVGGVTGQVVGPTIVDGNKQLQMFKDLTASSKDGISVFTLAPEIFTPAVAEAAKSGIPMIAVDNPPLNAWGVKLFVGNDNYELGRMLAREAIAKLPANAKGKIVIGTSAPAVKVLDRRAKGIRDELKAKLPGVTVVGPFDTKQETAANLAAWQTLAQVNKGALAFLGTGDADGWNLAEIRRTTKATWVAGAFDLDPKSLAAVKAGDLVLVSPEHFVKGEVAGWLQAQHAKDGEALPEGWIHIPGLAVNSNNIDTVIARQQSTQATAKAVAAQVDTILGDKSYLKKLSEVS
jgi:ribose transport system substrate-binding protein